MTQPLLPRSLRQVLVPPVKCQGIKTRLVPFISANISWDGKGTWIEPFLGSGVVAFNIAPTRALLCDSNVHIISLYRQIQSGTLAESIVRERLVEMGALLKQRGEAYYYEVRDRFNSTCDPMDLLFLNRSCFNGIMRFNGSGKYNVPFGKKTERFSQSYITKICNQVRRVRLLLQTVDYEFRTQGWAATLAEAMPEDFVYADPPYIGRHTDYFNKWSEVEAGSLAILCRSLPCGYALSMWKSNRFRENDHLKSWEGCEERSFNHFYHVGSTESLRHEMVEALLIKSGFDAVVPSNGLDADRVTTRELTQTSLQGVDW